MADGEQAIVVDQDKPEPLRTREAYEWVGQVLFTGGGEVLKAVSVIRGHPELAAAISIIFPTFGRAIGRGAYNVVTARREKLLAGYVQGVGGPEEAERQAQAKVDDPAYDELMFKTFRMMLDAADPSVVESLGYMAGQYTFAGKRPDMYFRGLGRLLCDLEAGELGELRRLLHGILECEEDLHEVGGADVVIDYHVFQEPSPQSTVDVYLGHDGWHSIGHVASAEKLFLLLKREGLAWNCSTHIDEKTEAAREATMQISFDQAKQILSTIDPSLPA